MKRFTKKLKLLYTACFAFLVFSVGALLSVPTTVPANAEGNILSTAFQTDGASVRVFRSQRKKNSDGSYVIEEDGSYAREFVETDKKGIRFHVEVGEGYEVAPGVPLVDVNKKNEKNDSYVIATGYKTYTLVIPTRLLSGGDLTPATDQVKQIETSDYWYTDKDGNWESVAYIYNVPNDMLTEELSFRGIICNPDGSLLAQTEVASRSLAWVAKQAYNDTIDENTNYWGTSQLDEDAAPLIKNFVPTYTITYKGADGNKLGDEEVLWGDAPQNVPTEGVKDAWYDTTASEEINVNQVMDFKQNRDLELTATNSANFVLTGVAAYSHTNGYNGVKTYATLPADKFEDGTEMDIRAINVKHSGSGTFTGLAGVWAFKEGDQMRLFFGFKSGTALSSGDKLTISSDSIFYAKGVMYKLTKEYVIDYDGIDYGVFLGYLNNAHVKAMYNAAEDASGQGGDPNDFTIRIEFYNDIMITDSYIFKHPDSDTPVYIQCGEDTNTKHIISGGQYYWVEDPYQPDGYTKILELIGTGSELNMAYGKHRGDELHGLEGTMLVQNGGYYIFQDEIFARFIPSQTHSNGVVDGVWTVGEESGAYGSEAFAQTGSYFASDNEIRFNTATQWLDTVEGAGIITLENMSSTEKNAVYYTSVDGTITPLTELVYHGYSGYKILGIRGIPTMKAGDTITIVAGTRFWFKQSYCTIGDLVGESRTKDVILCYNGDLWFSGFDASNNATLSNADVGGIFTDTSNGGEIRLWLDGSAKQVVTTEQTGHMFIDERTPALYNGVQISGLNKAFCYGSNYDLISLITNSTTAKAGDYFKIPASSVWWTTIYATGHVNRSITFTEDVEATYNGSSWVKGNAQATFDYVGGQFSVGGVEKGYLYQGNSYTFTVTPNSGYVVSKVSINNVEQALADSYTFIAQKSNVLQVETVMGYNVRFNVAEGAIVDGGAIANSTIKPVAQGDSLTFSVTPEIGYRITNVTGATDNGDGTYTVTPSGDTSVSITTEKQYKVTYSGANTSATADGLGTVTDGFSTWVPNGTSLTFTITATDGYTLISVSGATDNGNGTYTATVNGTNLTVTAKALATNSLTIANELLGLEDRSNWNPSANPDHYYFGITYKKGTNLWLNTQSNVSNAWNVTWDANYAPALIANNNGVDIMKYILINNQDARSLSVQNGIDNTYKGTTGWLANGGVCAPVFVETTTGSGFIVRVLKDFSTNSFTFTIKSGFLLPDENGNILYVSEDISYQFENGNLTKIINANQIDATDTLDIENRSSWAPNVDDNYCFGVTYQNGTNGYLNTTENLSCYWNDNPGKASLNNGVDIMEYIYINDTSARTLSNDNASGKTSYKGTTFPFTVGGIFAPITVESTQTGGIWIRIMKTYVSDLGGSFTLTIKKGFTILDEKGNQLLVKSDITYEYKNGTLSKVEQDTD